MGIGISGSKGIYTGGTRWELYSQVVRLPVSMDLSVHYQELPGWLYRCFIRGDVPVDLIPVYVAVGMCWYEVSNTVRIERREERLCKSCAEAVSEIFPMCVIAKYVDTKIYHADQAMARGLCREDHYCSSCTATLYALRDASGDDYGEVNDVLRDIDVPDIHEVMVWQEANEYDSGIEC